MNSVQENKNELEAAVRYCESAISRAKATIESMEFRQQAASKAWNEQTGREAALERDVKRLAEEIGKLKSEHTGREAALEREVTRLKGIIAEGNNVIDLNKDNRAKLVKKLAVMTDKYDQAKTSMALLTDEVEAYAKKYNELAKQKEASSGTCGCQGYRDKEEEIATLKAQLDELSKAYKDSTNEEITMKKAWREQRELVALKDDQIAMLERRLAKKEDPYPFQEGDTYYVFNGLDGTWIESVWDDESERLHDSPRIEARNHQVYFSVDQKKVLDQFNPDA